MIKSLFYSQFNPREGMYPLEDLQSYLLFYYHRSPGPKVIHQVPDGSIVPSPTSTQPPLVDFDSISSYVIPRQAFCDRLVSICNNRYRVLGHPVCINSRKYVRNQFIFNFSIVLEEDEDMSSYVTVVRRLAILFRSLEEQEGFLSKDMVDDNEGIGCLDGVGVGGGWQGKGRVYALCEMILEDLNNYCECMIPIGRWHHVCYSISTISTCWLRLFPFVQMNRIPSTSNCSLYIHLLHRSRPGMHPCRQSVWNRSWTRIGTLR